MTLTQTGLDRPCVPDAFRLQTMAQEGLLWVGHALAPPEQPKERRPEA